MAAPRPNAAALLSRRDGNEKSGLGYLAPLWTLEQIDGVRQPNQPGIKMKWAFSETRSPVGRLDFKPTHARHLPLLINPRVNPSLFEGQDEKKFTFHCCDVCRRGGCQRPGCC
jgi:hypothetical protein